MIALLVWLATAAIAHPQPMPKPLITPGIVRRDVSGAAVCSTHWGTDRRHVTPAMKQRVFAAYGIPWSQHDRYEVDHLVPRSLRGTPQPLHCAARHLDRLGRGL